ncbi:MAG: glycosyltransferase family 39 protein [Ignavibacteriales bacterium]|nr:MAG: glycosyltransferase family 39 protein [Ignavibacteriales bacterium]
MIKERADSKSLQKFISISLVLFLLTNLVFAVFQVNNSPYDHDELQHVHIGWNVHNGKIIYKDFFEHHGPVFAFFNSFHFDIFALQPETDTIVTLRYASFISLIAILCITFLIGREIFQSNFAGLFASALLSGLLFIREASTEVRPDVLQNVFWLGGVFIFLHAMRKEKTSLPFFSGIVLGLAVTTNSKAFVGVFAIYIYLALSWFLFKENRNRINKEGLMIALGIILMFTVIASYFIINNAFDEYIFYNFEFNLIALMEYHSRNLRELAGVFIKSQTVFVLSGIAAVAFLLSALIKSRFKVNDKKYLFLFVITLVSSTTIFLGLYKQQYILFLPFISILIFYIFKIFIDKAHINKRYIYYSMIFVILLYGNILYSAIEDTPFKKTTEQKNQNALTRFVIDNTDRSDPVFFLWNNCGGYMFNEDVQYFWLENEGFKSFYNRIVGYEVFGDRLIEKFEKKNVRYIVSPEKHLKNVLSEKAFTYILNNFSNENEFNGCLWIRKH